jgi:hypothetical protein
MAIRHFNMAGPKQRSIECVLICVVALIVDLSVLPMFYKATGTFSNSGLPGLATTAICAAVCVWAFGRCPPRPLFGKIVVLTLMTVALLIGLHEWLVHARGILY